MFCYRCGVAMGDQEAVCALCGAKQEEAPGARVQPSAAGTQPAQSAPTQPVQPQQPVAGQSTPQPVNPWLNVPPAPAYRGDQETDSKAILSLILGILALFPLWLLAGIPAIILGHVSKAEIRKSLGRLKGEGMATAGLVMGYISVASLPLVLIFAAILIPNLIRARVAANESAAASTVRTIVVSQITYSVSYPKSGYAAGLSMLGSGAPPISCNDSSQADANHACLISSDLSCTSPGWCFKNGYKFHLAGICGGDNGCADFVITAAPVTQGTTGLRSFCATADGVIRQSTSAIIGPLDSPDECKAWEPIR